jgi:hypothetical protein
MLTTSAALGLPGAMLQPLSKEFGWTTDQLSSVFALRFGLRFWLQAHPQKGGPLLAATDALLLFGVGMIATARIEMWLRCKRLIDAGAGTA